MVTYMILLTIAKNIKLKKQLNGVMNTLFVLILAVPI